MERWSNGEPENWDNGEIGIAITTKKEVIHESLLFCISPVIHLSILFFGLLRARPMLTIGEQELDGPTGLQIVQRERNGRTVTLRKT